MYMLKGQLDLDKCVPKGLDGDGLPATGKGARLFTFEVRIENFVHQTAWLYPTWCVYRALIFVCSLPTLAAPVHSRR